MQFPVYLKYKNNASFFKIISFEELEELKYTGKILELYHFKAKILPDRNYIADLLKENSPYVEKISEKEFEAHKVKLATS